MAAKIIASLLLIYVAAIICRGIYLYRERKEYLGYCIRKKGKVFYSEGSLASGILISSVFSLITAIFAFTDANTFMTALFAFTSLICSSLIISFCNCYIIYDDEKIAQGIFVGIKREFTYEEITAIEAHGGEVHICTGKKKIRVYADYTTGAKSDFLETVKKRYRMIHGSNLPQKDGFDIFRGNITDGNSRFVLICLVSLAIVALMVLASSRAFTNITETNTELFEMCLYHPEKKSGNIVFTSGITDESFKLPYKYLSDENYREILSLCEDGATFSVRAYRSDGGRYAEPYYRIAELSYEEKVFYTLSQANEFELSLALKFIIFAAVSLILMWTLTALQLYAAWHPDKFSKKFRRFLFSKKRR